MNMSPLHARVRALLEQLPLQHYKCAMDNLYMSAKLCQYVFIVFKFTKFSLIPLNALCSNIALFMITFAY